MMRLQSIEYKKLEAEIEKLREEAAMMKIKTQYEPMRLFLLAVATVAGFTTAITAVLVFILK